MRKELGLSTTIAAVLAVAFFLAGMLCIGQADAFWQSRDSNYNNISSAGGGAATYYISTTGSDSNNGLTIGTAWATPNHAVHCGDQIFVQPGTYPSTTFSFGFGLVSSCPSSSGIYFAILQCATSFACIVNDTTGHAPFATSQNNWAIIGMQASTTASDTQAFLYVASNGHTTHHVAFINDICTGAQANCFVAVSDGVTYGVDYFAVVGAISYNGASDTVTCNSGVDVYEPQNFDSNTGTHYFIAGVFSYKNQNPASCAGGAPSDGNGINFDTFNGLGTYTGQVAAEQNMVWLNGGRGVSQEVSTAAPFYWFNNTSYGNFQQTTNGYASGEVSAQGATGTFSVSNNLIESTVGSVSGGTVYACGVVSSTSATTFSGNFCYSTAGNNTLTDSATFTSNTTTTPGFTATANLPSTTPSCSSFGLVSTCMLVAIDALTATASGTSGKGYQPPGACTADAYFPTWLNGVVPVGLITMPCGAQSATYAPAPCTQYTTAAAGLDGSQNVAALSQLICGMVSDGTWALMDGVYVFAINSQANALINLVNPGTYNLTITATPTFTANAGFTGNGTTTRLNTSFTPSTAGGNMTQNSASFGACDLSSRTDASPSYILMGATDGTIYSYLGPYADTAELEWAVNDVGAAGVTSGLTNSLGSWATTRTSSTTNNSYLNGSLVQSNSVASTGNVAGPFTVLSLGTTGVSTLPTKRVTPSWAAA